MSGQPESGERQHWRLWGLIGGSGRVLGWIIGLWVLVGAERSQAVREAVWVGESRNVGGEALVGM